MNEHELRIAALKLAVEYAAAPGVMSNNSTLLAVAGQFYTFLTESGDKSEGPF